MQTIGALAMSLAAVPVYLLARRLGLSELGLALAALAVLVPDLVYASFVTSEPFAYPLVLAAVCAGDRRARAADARGRSSRSSSFAVLATLARVQFVVLPVVFLLAVVARRRRGAAAAACAARAGASARAVPAPAVGRRRRSGPARGARLLPRLSTSTRPAGVAALGGR